MSKAIFDEHNGDKPHSNVKHQCQCGPCKAHRAESAPAKAPAKKKAGK